MRIGSTIGSLLVLLIILFPTSIYAQEVENEREFDYAKGSEKGPSEWGKIHKEWSACNNGKMQSPIDLSNSRVDIIHKSKKLPRNYKPCTAIIVNRGHDIAVHWEGNAGSIDINGTVYALKQAHWHSPSEHTINSRRYSLELHMVHKSIDPISKHQIAVIGVLYKIGKPNPFLTKLEGNITSLVKQEKEHRHPGVIDPREIKMSCRRYYNYIGSLTVPPCTEGVIWTISKKVRSVSLDQVKLLRDAVHDVPPTNAPKVSVGLTCPPDILAAIETTTKRAKAWEIAAAKRPVGVRETSHVSLLKAIQEPEPAKTKRRPSFEGIQVSKLIVLAFTD